MNPPPKGEAILLVDHGSVKPEATNLLGEIARLLAALAPDCHVEAAHMELAQPGIPEGIAACVKAGARDITVVPYMLAPGRHSTNDIPRIATEAGEQHQDLRLRVSAPLGVDNRLAEVILKRVEEACGEEP